MEITRSEVQRIYERRFSGTRRLKKDQVWARIVREFFQKWIRPDDDVLDIGCGFGEFLNYIRCARRVGIDLNPEGARFLEPGIEFHSGDVRDLSALADESFEVVFTSNLLEHLPSKRDVERLIRDASRVLKRGGHLIALGPNLRFLPGEYWDFWDHQVGITDRSLVELLETLDLEIVDCIPRFLPYTTHSSLPSSPWLVTLYLKVPLAWPILGKQFLVRARKP
jgi:SAM-dependent methyltransferase